MNWYKLASKERTQADFTALGSYQRGVPESKMLTVQFAMGGGVLNPVVEHGGDLIHRMNEDPTFESAGYEYVYPKVEKVLRALTYPYGFEKEMQENIVNNAKHHGTDPQKLKEAVHEALDEYAKAHAATPVFNEAQRVVRDVAVAIGERRWNDAIAGLKEIKKHLKSVKAWKAWAHEGLASFSMPESFS